MSLIPGLGRSPGGGLGNPLTHYILIHNDICVLCAQSLQSCLSLCDPMDCTLPGSSVFGDSPGRNTGVGFHALLQGIFPTQGLNLCPCCYC